MAKRDLDLETMTPGQLKDALQALRDALRPMANAKGHDLCHHWPEVFRHLPEFQEPGSREVPQVCDFMEECALFRYSLGGTSWDLLKHSLDVVHRRLAQREPPTLNPGEAPCPKNNPN